MKDLGLISFFLGIRTLHQGHDIYIPNLTKVYCRPTIKGKHKQNETLCNTYVYHQSSREN